MLAHLNSFSYVFMEILLLPMISSVFELMDQCRPMWYKIHVVIAESIRWFSVGKTKEKIYKACNNFLVIPTFLQMPHRSSIPQLLTSSFNKSNCQGMFDVTVCILFVPSWLASSLFSYLYIFIWACTRVNKALLLL